MDERQKTLDAAFALIVSEVKRIRMYARAATDYGLPIVAKDMRDLSEMCIKMADTITEKVGR